MIAGICGGFGEFFGIDPTLVRIFFVLFSFAGGSGILLYFILWLLIPGANQQDGFITRETMRDFLKEVQESTQNVKDSLNSKKEKDQSEENKN